MARKNKTLPKDFEEIVERGNLDELKAVFDKCDINAYMRNRSITALFFEGLTPEFVNWAVEQGADVNFCKSRTDPTPLCYQVKYQSNATLLAVIDRENSYLTPTKDNSEIIELLIALGAEIEPENYHQPLSNACYSINPTAIKILLKHGADPNGKSATNSLYDILNRMALVPNTLECAEILLDAGVQVTEGMQQFVRIMGKKYNDNPDYYRHIKTSKNILNRLYELFDVEPVKPTIKHDGISEIIITESNLQEAYRELWDYLVPTNGKAETVQGEAIRISGRVAHEIGGNGGINWDDNFKCMLDTLMDILKSENALSKAEFHEAERLKKIIYHGNSRKWNEAEELSNYAVMWVKQNPSPIKVKN